MKKILILLFVFLLTIPFFTACNLQDKGSINLTLRSECMDNVHVILEGQPINDPKTIILWPGDEAKETGLPPGEYNIHVNTHGEDFVMDYSVSGPSGQVTNVSHTFCPGRDFTLVLESLCPAGGGLNWHVKIVDVERNTTATFDTYTSNYTTRVYLEPGKYLITDWTEDGSFRRGPVEVDGTAGGGYTYTMRLCEPTPTPAPTATITPTSAPTQDPAFLLPRKYYFANNCVGEPFGRAKDGVYWVFTLLESFTGDTGSVGKILEVFIPLGESRSGELPAGRYHVQHWIVGQEDSLMDYEDNFAGDQDPMVVHFCPDMPLLPDAP